MWQGSRSGNIAGAVAGGILAGFYLLRFYDVTFATFVAVIINALVDLVKRSREESSRVEN